MKKKKYTKAQKEIALALGIKTPPRPNKEKSPTHVEIVLNGQKYYIPIFSK